MTTGEKLRALRIEEGITVAELADRLRIIRSVWIAASELHPSKPEPPAPTVPTLAERREAIGWSQERLAKALAIGPTVIQRVEVGDWCHSGARRNALAAIFGCTREEIDESVEETKRRAQ